MRPELFTVGPFTLHSFGAMLALGLVAAWWFARKDLSDRRFDPDDAFWLVGAAAVGGIVGARLYYVADNWGDPGLGLFSGSGLTWYGGLFGGVVAVAAAAKAREVPLGVAANIGGPALAIGYGIGRIGCQLAGDGDYGSASDLPWAMSYPEGTVPTDELVHPTPIYETLSMIVLFYVLWRLRGRFDRPWALFGIWAVAAGLERFLIEFIRRNDPVAIGLTAAQLTALGLVAVGVALLATGRRATPAIARASNVAN
jgi:phosphatidylglycerol---prolipoprotein diacylglyceryl transferase